MSNDKMKEAFKKRYPSRAIELALEKTGAISRLESINARHKFAAFEQGWQACAEAMQQSQPVPEWDGMDQDWKGMSGAIAFHLIDRHADGWDQIGAMMAAWLEANKVPQDHIPDAGEMVPAKRLRDDEIDIMTTAMWGKQLGVMMQAHRTYARTIEAKILGEQA